MLKQNLRICLLALILLGLGACGTLPPERQLELTVTAAGYDSPRLEARVGEQVFIRFRNADVIAHNLTIELPSGRRTVSAEAGVDAILAFPARQAGAFRMFCTVPGHTEQGELVILP
ncbi:MAG: cupredoxin domain-containing protein [Oscillochloridaceae bacterium]|nr:cupredoxin domain-containing protein [Chloroflexaceae bacterium]MDW8388550.1 cupredoxin domain-containing protein [Oscillochloridaceae bacterium]